MGDGQTNVERLIFHAVRAGAFRAAARQFKDAAPTFEAAADVNSAKACRLADEIAKPGPCRASGVRIGG